MSEKRCLSCYQPLDDAGRDFHAACSRKFFGTPDPPEIPYALNEMYALAGQIVQSSISVTGVQAKISMDVETFHEAVKRNRLTIVGMWGQYVLKPPSEEYDSLPELEDVTLHLAELFKIRTVPHSLIRLRSGELAYITRRVDRVDREKFHMEDFCQLDEKLTEHKYNGSMERAGKIIKRFSENRGFDLLEFFHVALFSFLTGNADMHLKNFSLLSTKDGIIGLSPVYDLVPTKIALPEDLDEMALTVNGKKRQLRKNDFLALAKSLDISDVVLQNSLKSFRETLPNAVQFIESSFLSPPHREQYRAVLNERGSRINLIGL
ncbi:MAG: HipA domain-containing protein [Bacteroidota bacterium]